jgi:hypothetical protein
MAKRPAHNLLTACAYIQAHGLTCTPRELFQEDILSAIRRWIEHGDRILIFIDMNEHILTGHLAKAFQCLGLLEATHLNWKGSEPRRLYLGRGNLLMGCTTPQNWK